MFMSGAVSLLNWAYAKLLQTRVVGESFPLLELPTELTEEIVNKLDYGDRCRLACVCSSLKLLADESLFWERLFEELLPGLAATIAAGKPRWWGRSSWKQRFRKLISGSRFKCQVFNRELDNTAEDFLLSAYDATAKLLSLTSDTGSPLFEVTYLPMTRDRVVEQPVTLDRLRSVPAGSSPYRVFKSTLDGIAVGDDVELQWKGMKSHPFGWWLGRVVEVRADGVVLMFRQYPEHSPWRVVVAPCGGQQEQLVNWDDRYGYVGGIRRLAGCEQGQWVQQVQVVTQMVARAAAGAADRSPEQVQEQEQQEEDDEGEAGDEDGGEQEGEMQE